MTPKLELLKGGADVDALSQSEVKQLTDLIVGREFWIKDLCLRSKEFGLVKILSASVWKDKIAVEYTESDHYHKEGDVEMIAWTSLQYESNYKQNVAYAKLLQERLRIVKSRNPTKESK